MIDTTSVLGYAWPLAAAAGERIQFHLSSASLSKANVRVVRVRCGDHDPLGPGLRTTAMEVDIGDSLALKFQPIYPGSYAIVEDRAAFVSARDLSFGCYLFPTIVGGKPQTIASRWNGIEGTGWKLELDHQGCLCLVVGADGKRAIARAPKPLLVREWAFVGAIIAPSQGRIEIHQFSLARDGGRDRSASAEAACPNAFAWPAKTPLILAAESTGAADGKQPTTQHYNGKIDRPRLYNRALPPAALRGLVEALRPTADDPNLLAAWDFSQGISGDRIVDLSANRCDGLLRQLPMRAATGANWDGAALSWNEAPWQYGAIHFHEDDLQDCNWEPTCSLTIPSNWRSGFYALELTADLPSGRVESHVSFFVRAPRGRATAPLLFVASTATFLAYANIGTRLDQSGFEVHSEGLVTLSADDIYLSEHRELGLSSYDTHADGSGVCYSSGARPILNMRPRGNAFNYVNDTHILDWLEEQNIDYDVLTDEDIDREGARALKPYCAVITGSHPEYVSRPMLDAFQAYQNGGGRHMYLGGNGFYWRIAFHPDRIGQIEIRRSISGTRTWEGEAGENNLSFTGEPSGLWRSNGRAPQRLVGVGFDAQVFDRSTFYRRMPDSFNPRIAFAFEGIGSDDRIGDFGLRLGGAAGLEIDRADRTLGSAPNLLILATANQFGSGGLPTPEEFRTTHRGLTGDQNAQVRADIVFFETSAGGAVFATGSIAWCCALSHKGYDNNVSRLTGNVLRRFLDPNPFDEGASSSVS
jgi:N,N-dimethylformamidase